MAAPDILKEWKVAITSVLKKYESIESRHNYKIRIGTTFEGREALMDIRKSKDNFDKNRKPRCFNCNIYGYMAKKC